MILTTSDNGEFVSFEPFNNQSEPGNTLYVDGITMILPTVEHDNNIQSFYSNSKPVNISDVSINTLYYIFKGNRNQLIVDMTQLMEYDKSITFTELCRIFCVPKHGAILKKGQLGEFVQIQGFDFKTLKLNPLTKFRAKML